MGLLKTIIKERKLKKILKIMGFTDIIKDKRGIITAKLNNIKYYNIYFIEINGEIELFANIQYTANNIKAHYTMDKDI